MAILRRRFALLFGLPADIRSRGRIAVPGTAVWDRHFPELQCIGESFAVPFAHLPPGIPRWQAMSQWIHEQANTVDGVVIVHDRSTLIPGAVVLDLTSAAEACPVIITVPSAHDVNDWRTNVVVAMQAAVVGVPGPVVVDGNRVVRAGTVGWESPNVLGGNSAARLDFGVRRIPLRRSAERPTTAHTLSNEMMITELTPGLALPPVPGQSVSVLLRAGQAPDWTSIERWIKRLPTGSRVILQTTERVPRPVRSWPIVPTVEDDVAMVQAAWAFSQGKQWKRAVRTALERRRV